MSPVVATLEPIHRQNEVLLSGCVRRPTLTLYDEGPPLVLGRNHTTGIALTSISRKVVTITCSHGKVWMHQGNTMRRLASGDVVYLQKQSTDYAYRVQLHEIPNSTTTTTPPPHPPSLTKTTSPCPRTGTKPPAAAYSCAALQEASEEVMCAVCMEIIVEATAVVTCGHTYCGTCLKSLSECPNCRLAVKQTIPLKGMDNLIHKLVVSQSVFCPHDMQQYWKRIQGVRVHKCGLLSYISNTFLTCFCFFGLFRQSPIVQSSPPRKRIRLSTVETPSTQAFDLTIPRRGDTVDDAICID